MHLRDFGLLLFHLVVSVVRVMRPVDRIIVGLFAGMIRLARLLRSAIVLKPATWLSEDC
jgi:hypothetical protein